MRMRPDKAHVPKLHVVFKATKFQTAGDWHDQEERQLWDDWVVVSFQSNSWVEAETHMYGLKEVMGPINDHLELENELKGTSLCGVSVEDNLSSHQTKAVFDLWREEPKNFGTLEFVPANMTDIIQVIDRHIGVIYKKSVYMAVRKELMRRLQWARQEAGRADGVTIPLLAPCEKRIIITKAIPDCHERLINSNAHERAFIATATWMPISHLVRDKSSMGMASR